jgi:hypothetical protein
VSTTKPGDPRARELVRRIEELEAHDEATFGQFTGWDWVVCVALGLVLPIFLMWQFAP